jgi:hypothetical protein
VTGGQKVEFQKIETQDENNILQKIETYILQKIERLKDLKALGTLEV